VSSAISTAMLIRDFSPDYIINIGSAGAACANLKLGDVVVSTQALYHDADATTWGYELGQVPNQPVHFKPDESLLDVAKKLQGDDVHFGQIVSGDAFVSDEQQLAKIKNTFPDAIALDMESAAIAQTCHQLGTPFLICRAISDNGDDDATDTHTDNLQFSSERSAKFALRLLKALETAEITLKEAK